ncbi:hypothetical protein AB0L13_33525 [Saccharopolyspora shandongensis]|uniref:hypothetical protein n=1 Tax=Saccharopolyspora shandongensis TaxID=418495 RepID=UPI0034149C55
MTRPVWYSQPFPPEGATAAEGIRSQLGRPELDLLTILVRESAQNSWDARLPAGTEPVDFRISLRNVSAAYANIWRDLLLRGAPLSAQLPLRSSLQKPTIPVMEISDRGTSGLGGPTRADHATPGERDFVSFVRNIGEPRDTELGGGTYGFGKGIFYLISKPGTILLHTRCKVGDGYETRLMGCALWKSYTASQPDGERRYTGRHWWGDTSSEVVEPLVGQEAIETAHRLGLKPFAEAETGTTIVVIDPNLDDREPAEAAEYLAHTMTWHLWPKMLDRPDAPSPMRFSVLCNGVNHTVPDPRTTRPLDLFVKAYEAMVGDEAKRLWCKHPKAHLGDLGLVKRLAPPIEPTPASRLVGLENLVHHVCLMRSAELVVTYRPGPKPPSEYTSYAGVFRADTTKDAVYAAAEPPTHDAWNPQSLEYPESTFIRTTFRRIDESISGLLNLGGTVREGSAKVSLGAASRLFSSLVGGTWGIGGATDYAKPGSTQTRPTHSESADELQEDDLQQGRRAPSNDMPPTAHQGQLLAAQNVRANPQEKGSGSQASRKAPRRRPRVQYAGEPYFDERSGHAVLIQEFQLPVPGPQRVRADIGVAVAGTAGRETDPPIGADNPELLGWENATTGLFFSSAMKLIEGGPDIWRAVIRPAPDTMTEIEIAVEAVTVP